MVLFQLLYVILNNVEYKYDKYSFSEKSLIIKLYIFFQIKNLYNESTLSKEFKYLLKQRFVDFIQRNKSDAVFYMFKHFFNILEEDDNGFFILEEMISCNYVSKFLLY